MKTHTEEDLRKLAGLIDDAYRGVTRDNFKGSDVVEDFINGVYDEKPIKEKEIPITYGLIKATCGWSKFAETTDRNVWTISEFGDYEPNEVFYITESQAKQLKFI